MNGDSARASLIRNLMFLIGLNVYAALREFGKGWMKPGNQLQVTTQSTEEVTL